MSIFNRGGRNRDDRNKAGNNQGGQSADDVEARFAYLSGRNMYSSLVKLCQEQLFHSVSDKERAFWCGQLSTTYLLYGDGLEANSQAQNGLMYAKKAGLMSSIIHCLTQLTVIPVSPEQFNDTARELGNYAGDDYPALGRAKMFTQAVDEGMSLSDLMLTAAESTGNSGLNGRGQAASIVSVLISGKDDFRLDDEKYRELLLYYSSTLSLLSRAIRESMCSYGSDDYREYLPILHPAIRMLKSYVTLNSSDEEVHTEYTRITVDYQLMGDPSNKNSPINTIESLNKISRRCRRCGMPVTGDRRCLECGSQN